MNTRQVGVIWPEPVQPVHVEELERLAAPELQLDVEAMDLGPSFGPGVTLRFVEQLAVDPSIERVAQRMAARGAQALAYGCTSGSFSRGPDVDAAITARMQEASGLPATTTSTALVAALRLLDARRVAVLTPYVDEINDRLRSYLETSGFDVTAMVGLGRLVGIERIDPAETQTIVETQVDTPDSDAVFISCTGMCTADILAPMQQALAKPVLSANQVTLWKLAHLAGVPTASLEPIAQPPPVPIA